MVVGSRRWRQRGVGVGDWSSSMIVCSRVSGAGVLLRDRGGPGVPERRVERVVRGSLIVGAGTDKSDWDRVVLEERTTGFDDDDGVRWLLGDDGGGEIKELGFILCLFSLHSIVPDAEFLFGNSICRLNSM
jgi:hypothetical protein